MMRIALVVAAARHGVIGKAGALPWRIRDDLKWFKQVTMGKPIVMGRKTYESIGKPLPGRANFVISRDPALKIDGVSTAASLDGALELARLSAEACGAAEICVIGGGQIYAQALPRADRIYMTAVDAQPDGDTLFPALEPAEWSVAESGKAEKSAVNDFDCTFLIMDRIRKR